MANNPEEFPPAIRVAFDAYPRPTGDDEFDAKFWRELDERHNRYRGFVGVLRRVIEVEIEGIAVWRLGLSLFGGAAVCAVGVALLSFGSAPVAPTQSAPQIAEMDGAPMALPRYAREWWDEPDWQRPAPVQQKPVTKEEISCVSFARDLA